MHDTLSTMLEFFADFPLAYISLVIGAGALIGRISVGGVSLGAVAVLLFAMSLTALGVSVDVILTIPDIVGELSLALFAYTIGIVSGPVFFHAIRTAYPIMLAIAGILIAGGTTAYAVGQLMGLPSDTIAGTFAGALTNTPALAAAGSTPEATVGYATAYIFGLIGMLILTNIAVNKGANDTDAPVPVVDVTLRVDAVTPHVVADLRARHGGQLKFSRIQHDGAGPAELVGDHEELRKGDLVTVVGPGDEVQALISEVGHASTHDLTLDRSQLDFRRITISNPKAVGRTIASLGLEHRFNATLSRVRRGDVDMVATPDLVLQLGDRLRVVAPTLRMDEVTHYFGDSNRGMTDINPSALGFGLLIGLLLGSVPIPLPGIEALEIGVAGGTLIAGLAMGRIGRIGRIVTSLPNSAALVISELGLLVFLAYAGTKAGSLILEALSSGEVVYLFCLGAVITLVVGIGTFLVMRWIFTMGGTRLSGVIGGTQTQPALLAFANARTGSDPRVALGYALVYPTAMVMKILIAQVMASL